VDLMLFFFYQLSTKRNQTFNHVFKKSKNIYRLNQFIFRTKI